MLLTGGISIFLEFGSVSGKHGKIVWKDLGGLSTRELKSAFSTINGFITMTPSGAFSMGLLKLEGGPNGQRN